MLARVTAQALVTKPPAGLPRHGAGQASGGKGCVDHHFDAVHRAAHRVQGGAHAQLKCLQSPPHAQAQTLPAPDVACMGP